MSYDDDALFNRPEFTPEDALRVLPMDSSIVPGEVVYGFSDLEPDQLEQIRPVWRGLPTDQRVIIMERLNEASEADYMLDYSTFSSIGYDDPSAAVRVAAISAGWSDESLPTLRRLTELVEFDPSQEVRAAAISQLGKFIYLGEMEDLSLQSTDPVAELMIEILQNPGEPLEVRRRALEAVANSSRPTVPGLIEDAYRHDDLFMQISAVIAMGNTMDDRWAPQVLQELDSEYTEMVFEAIRAAGNIGLSESVVKIGELAYSDDEQVQEAAIWSLGEIGGDESIVLLRGLEAAAEQQGNEDLLESIDEALETARLLMDLELEFAMLEYDDDEDEEYEDEDYEDED
jgi:HEAT repeat protein